MNSNSDLTSAFPKALRGDALQVVSALPEPRYWLDRAFRVCVGGESVSVPYRIYHDPAAIDLASLGARQRELIDCLLTRHCNGFIRERHLAAIIGTNNEWIPPFVIQLAGEYVVEILQVINKNLHRLDPQLYRSFLLANPQHFELTKQRVVSYWDCYYRGTWKYRRDYAGFQIIEFMERLIA